jgi:Cd2+/Zn2+-exporting ATPase
MTTSQYRIGGMDCANCAREVETGVASLSGVQHVSVDFASAKMTVEGDLPFDTLRTRVEALGKTVAPLTTAADEVTAQDRSPERGGVLGFWDYLLARGETRLALGGGAVVMVTALVKVLFNLPEAISVAAYIVGMLITLGPILKSGLNTLRINREFSINLLMSIATVGAILIGEYLEGATVIFLFAVGEALEGYTVNRARNSIRGLMALKPTEAVRLHGDAEEHVKVTDLRLDDVILIKPGEQIAMDGVVLAGASSINQAPITGESVPVAKQIGAEVFAGTINGEGTLQVRITRLSADNTLSRLIALVEQAQSVRAPSQRLVDRFAQVYTPAVVVMALLVATIPPLLFNAPFLDTPDAHGWLYRALSMLVIACPCALVISTPVTVISAITAAARRGVLIKGGAHLEALGTVRAVAFDKTGTLTRGTPIVTEYRAADCALPSGTACHVCDDVLALAAALERRTAHPLAQAVVNAATRQHLDTVYRPAEAVEMLAGQGVRGRVGASTVTIGSHSLFDAHHPHTIALCDQVSEAEARGQTTMLVAERGADGERVRGYIALADTARDSSREVVAALNRMGMATVMLTGDNPTVARAVAAQIGLTDVRAGLLPAAKLAAVKELMARYGHVAMVGDGVNDTPALAAASVGIAMGGAGSPQALETAHVALMADDLWQLPFAVRLSRFARHLIQQNVALSFALKAVFLVLAFAGVTSLWVAVFADVGMSLAVTLNGMRPLAMRE